VFFRKVLSTNQLEYTINNYLEGFPYHNNTAYKVHDSKDWLDGEIVVVESDEMIGLVYLEKTFGIYRVENHVLSNKNDVLKTPYINELEYQYRLLRVKSFVDEKDVLFAYINDEEIQSFKMEMGSNEVRFQLPENRMVILSEVDRLYSSIKTHSEVEFIEWKDEKLQDMIKYNSNSFVYKSDNLIKIAVVGGFRFNFKTDHNIIIDNIKLNAVDNLSSEDYDALFINTSISDEKVDELIKCNWDTYIINPNNNLKDSNNKNFEERLIILRKGNSIGKYSKFDFYDLRTNYFVAYSSIFEHLSNRKE
jgi:hypothetical protein